MWIRPSTGRLCVDLVPDEIKWYSALGSLPSTRGFILFKSGDQDTIEVDPLILEQDHDICYWELSRFGPITTDLTVNLGPIFVCSLGEQLEGSHDNESLPKRQVDVGLWHRTKGEVVENGWTRYIFLFIWQALYLDHVYSQSLSCGVVLNSAAPANVWCPHSQSLSWLGQGNHVFNCLQITSEFENYCTCSTHDMDSSRTCLHSCCSKSVFKDSSLGRNPLWLSIPPPRNGFSHRSIVVQMARLSGLLVAGPFGRRTSQHGGGSTSRVSLHRGHNTGLRTAIE
jgi:hypothetical protein